MREKLRYKDKLTSEMGENPNASIMNTLTKTSEMGENPNASIMNTLTKTSEMGENPLENAMINLNESAQLQQLPFDVLNNYKLINSQIGYDKNLMEWVKKQSNFKGIIPFYFTPITENQKQYELFNFEFSNSDNIVSRNRLNGIPLQNVEIITDSDCNFTSITLIILKNGVPYKVISKKDYGIIKSRYLIDSNGSIKNYEKCDLVPYDGEYKEYRWNWKSYGDNYAELNKVFNYANGVKHGECKTYYKSDYPFHSLGSSFDRDKFKNEYWYELFTYDNGKKVGLYENTKNLERGILKDGKRVGEWIIVPPKDIFIPNFNEVRRNGEEVFDRMKCNYIDSKLEGKWEGITKKEFFGYSQNINNIHKVGGEFKNGIMDGEFYSEFWDEKYLIIKGKYKNNKRDGEWVSKQSDISFLGDWLYDKEFTNGKQWYELNKSNDERYYSSDEVVDYQIITSVFDSNKNSYYDLLNTKTETYKCRELIRISGSNSLDKTYSFTLSNENSDFKNFTKKYIPTEHQNTDFTLIEYEGRIIENEEEKFVQIKFDEENILGSNKHITNDVLLKNGYPFTKVGVDLNDRSKTKNYISLPTNSKDYLSLGNYKTLRIDINSKSNNVVLFDDEIFEIGQFNLENDSNFKFRAKKQQMIDRIVNLLIFEKKKELKEIEEKESNILSFFPID
jgi:hypothetical protein